MGNMSVGGLLFISWRFEFVAAATEYKRVGYQLTAEWRSSGSR